MEHYCPQKNAVDSRSWQRNRDKNLKKWENSVFCQRCLTTSCCKWKVSCIKDNNSRPPGLNKRIFASENLPSDKDLSLEIYALVIKIELLPTQCFNFKQDYVKKNIFSKTQKLLLDVYLKKCFLLMYLTYP